MRVISGKHKGKILSEFKGKDIRPTSDRAREALFNIIQFNISGCFFLDAFCGTGAVGIEALSRNAEKVVFTDLSMESIVLTKKNLLSVKENAEVIKIDAVSYLKSTPYKFDFIFLDPPYDLEIGKDCLKIIAERKLLKEKGLVIYEHRRSDKFDCDFLDKFDMRNYGVATFEFYR